MPKGNMILDLKSGKSGEYRTALDNVIIDGVSLGHAITTSSDAYLDKIYTLDYSQPIVMNESETPTTVRVINEESYISAYCISGNLLTARQSAAGAGGDTTTVISGGMDSANHVINSTEIMTENNTRTSVVSAASGNTLKKIQLHCAAGEAHTAVVIMGGIDRLNDILGDVESFNGTIWSAGSGTLSTPRAGACASGTKTDCGFICGASAINSTGTDIFESYNGNTFTTKPQTLCIRYGASSTGHGTYGIILTSGATNYGGKITESCEEFNGTTWSAISDIIIPVYNSSSIGHSNDVNIIGGSTGYIASPASQFNINVNQRYTGWDFFIGDSVAIPINGSVASFGFSAPGISGGNAGDGPITTIQSKSSTLRPYVKSKRDILYPTNLEISAVSNNLELIDYMSPANASCTWSIGSMLNEGKVAHASCGKYAAGGISPATSGGFSNARTSKFMEGVGWIQTPDSNSGSLKAGCVNNTIGGNNDGYTPLNAHYEVNPTNDTWSTKAALAFISCSLMGATSSALLSSGGVTSTEKATTNSYLYNGTAWSAQGDLMMPLEGHGSFGTTTNGKTSGGTNGFDATNYSFVFNGSEWFVGGLTCVKRAHHTHNDDIICGGVLSNNAHKATTSSCEKFYNIVWYMAGDQNVPRGYQAGNGSNMSVGGSSIGFARPTYESIICEVSTAATLPINKNYKADILNGISPLKKCTIRSNSVLKLEV